RMQEHTKLVEEIKNDDEVVLSVEGIRKVGSKKIKVNRKSAGIGLPTHSNFLYHLLGMSHK
ncbi:hypothetical protein MKX03_024607, partial [Papaver bracteatum]